MHETFAGLVILLQVFDGWVTWQILKRGGTELNPLLVWLMTKVNAEKALVLSKSVGVIGALALMLIGGDLALVGLVLLTVFYGWVAYRNYGVYRKMVP